MAYNKKKTAGWEAGAMPFIGDYFPIWNELGEPERRRLEQNAVYRSVPCGTALSEGEDDCVGLIVVHAGRLRACILSDEGREITLYRLFEGDVCLFSASCILTDLQVDIRIEAEVDTSFWVIPAGVYQALAAESVKLSGFTSSLMATRFSEVMWRMDQILFQRFDQRLAAFLLDESAVEGTDELEITHERIARHMGSAREVVTRMLKYFQSEGLVTLSRGGVALTDRKRLRALAK